MAVRKNKTWKKTKKKQYHVPYNINVVGENFKCGKVQGDGDFGEENQVVGNFTHPWFSDLNARDANPYSFTRTILSLRIRIRKKGEDPHPVETPLTLLPDSRTTNIKCK